MHPQPGPRLTCPFHERHHEGARRARAQGSNRALPAAGAPALEVAFQLPVERLLEIRLGHPHEQRGRRAAVRGHGSRRRAGAPAPASAGAGTGAGVRPASSPWASKFQFRFPRDPSLFPAQLLSFLSLLPSLPPSGRVSTSVPCPLERWAPKALASPFLRAWPR